MAFRVQVWVLKTPRQIRGEAIPYTHRLFGGR
jgi:hypothetical protein